MVPLGLELEDIRFPIPAPVPVATPAPAQLSNKRGLKLHHYLFWKSSREKKYVFNSLQILILQELSISQTYHSLQFRQCIYSSH